jgi:hypothetical protein
MKPAHKGKGSIVTIEIEQLQVFVLSNHTLMARAAKKRAMKSYLHLLAATVWLLLFNPSDADLGRRGRSVHAPAQRPRHHIVGNPNRLGTLAETTRSALRQRERESKARTKDHLTSFVKAVDKPIQTALAIVAMADNLNSYASLYALLVARYWFLMGVLLSDTPKVTVLAERILWATAVFLLVGCLGTWTGHANGVLIAGWATAYLGTMHHTLAFDGLKRTSRSSLVLAVWCCAASCTALWSVNWMFSLPVLVFQILAAIRGRRVT